MILLKLANGMDVTLDDIDAERILKHKWYAFRGSKTWYAVRDYATPKGIKQVQMHREILGINDAKILVDHKDRCGLNNARDNLRLCTMEQNMQNRGCTRANKSGFKGVCRNGGKWRATITVSGRWKSIGNFEKLEDAAFAYAIAAYKYHGEFACVA